MELMGLLVTPDCPGAQVPVTKKVGKQSKPEQRTHVPFDMCRWPPLVAVGRLGALVINCFLGGFPSFYPRFRKDESEGEERCDWDNWDIVDLGIFPSKRRAGR